MKIKLDPRLELCAGLVSGDFVIDVGTDHAYLPCFLAEKGISALACDIAEGPLKSAEKTVTRLGLGESVMLLRSDGLKDIPDELFGRASDIVAAGMGGELIAEIVAARSPIRGKRLILQPNTRAARLREALAELGYETLSEQAVRDGRFIYTVICAEFRGNFRKLTLLEAHVGKLERSDPVSREYIENETAKLSAAARGKAKSSNQGERSEAFALTELAENMKKYLGEF